MSDDVPTPGEMVRRLDEVSRRLDEVSRRVEDREQRMEAAFVRKDVFDARRQTDDVESAGIARELNSLSKRMDDTEAHRRTDRNLLLSGLAFPLLVAMLVAVVLSGRM